MAGPITQLELFPPRLAAYLLDVRDALTAAIVTRDRGRLVEAVEVLASTRSTVAGITAGMVSEWILANENILAESEPDAFAWAVQLSDLIAEQITRTPQPSTSQVFSRPEIVEVARLAATMYTRAAVALGLSSAAITSEFLQ